MVPQRRHLILRGPRRASGLARNRSAPHCPQRMDSTLEPLHTSPALYGHVFKTFARDIEPPQALSIKYSVKPQ